MSCLGGSGNGQASVRPGEEGIGATEGVELCQPFTKGIPLLDRDAVRYSSSGTGWGTLSNSDLQAAVQGVGRFAATRSTIQLAARSNGTQVPIRFQLHVWLICPVLDIIRKSILGRRAASSDVSSLRWVHAPCSPVHLFLPQTREVFNTISTSASPSSAVVSIIVTTVAFTGFLIAWSIRGGYVR